MLTFLFIAPIAAFLTGLGIWAWRRKQPMWFWAGSEIKPEEITDVRAFNRANGLMWIGYSLFLWLAAFLAFHSGMAAFWGLLASVLPGFPLLLLCWHRIEKRYRA